jgi:hypothetical protein
VNPSKAERRKQQKILLKKKESEDKAIYAAIIACAVLFVCIHSFKPLSIGSDNNYTFFVIILPIIIGISLLIGYRKKIFNTEAIASITNMWKNIGTWILLLFVATLFSFLTFGTLASLSFEVANYCAAKDSKQQTVILPVEQFLIDSGRHKNHAVYFLFEGDSEKVGIELEEARRYMASGCKHIKVTIRKGLWNHYLVDDFDIVK